MPSSLLVQVSWIALFFICALAQWKGGEAERLGSAFSIITAFVVLLINDFAPDDAAPLLLLGADALLAIGFLVLAVRYASLWLGAAMIFQAGQFALHAYYTAGELAHDRRYAVINNVVTLAIFSLILSATLASWRKRVVASRAVVAESSAA